MNSGRCLKLSGSEWRLKLCYDFGSGAGFEQGLAAEPRRRKF
jgi:hypothetical protein